MRRAVCLSVVLLFFGVHISAWSQDQKPSSPKKLPDGVYAVLRESLKEKEVLPLKDGETLIVHRHKYVKTKEQVPPRFLVVRSAPDVSLDLVGEPKVIKEGKEVAGILLQLQPKAANALEKLTQERLGKALAIIIDGEVVTSHTIRSVIKGGAVQITNCAPGPAVYLLEQLQARQKKNEQR